MPDDDDHRCTEEEGGHNYRKHARRARYAGPDLDPLASIDAMNQDLVRDAEIVGTRQRHGNALVACGAKH